MYEAVFTWIQKELDHHREVIKELEGLEPEQIRIKYDVFEVRPVASNKGYYFLKKAVVQFLSNHKQDIIDLAVEIARENYTKGV